MPSKYAKEREALRLSSANNISKYDTERNKLKNSDVSKYDAERKQIKQQTKPEQSGFSPVEKSLKVEEVKSKTKITPNMMGDYFVNNKTTEQVSKEKNTTQNKVKSLLTPEEYNSLPKYGYLPGQTPVKTRNFLGIETKEGKKARQELDTWSKKYPEAYSKLNSYDLSNKDYSKSDAAILSFGDAATLGAASTLANTLYKNNMPAGTENLQIDPMQKAKEQQPGAYTAGTLLGYVTPGSLATKGTGMVAKPIIKKISSNIGKKAAEGAIAGAGLETVEGVIRGESAANIGKRVAAGAALGAAGDVAAYGIGKGIKIIADKIKTGKLHTSAEKETVKNTLIDDAIPDTKKYIATKTTKPNTNIKNVSQKGYTSLIDDLYPISKTNDEAYIKALNSRQADMIAHRSLTTGLVNKNGEVVGKSLADITKSIPKGLENNFEDYLINRRASYWMEQGKKVFPDEAKMTPEKSRAKVAEYEAMHPQFKQLGDEYIKYNQDLTKTWLVDSGIISPEAFDNMVKLDPDYVPFQRQFEDIEKGAGIFAKKGFVNQKNPIKKATGSQRKIIPPIESTIQKTGQYIKAAKRNEVAQSILNDVRMNPEEYSGIIEIVPPKTASLSNDAITDINKILQEEGIDGLVNKFNEPWERQQFFANRGGAIESGANIVTVMENGAPVHMKVNDPDLLKALTNLNPQQATAIIRGVGKITGMMKTLTTGINPVFGLARNVWRDLATGYINSKTIGMNPLGYAQYLWDLTKAIGNTIAEPLGRSKLLPETFQELFAKGGEPMAYFKNIGGGGHVSSISSDRNLLAKAKADILPKSNLRKVASVPGKIYRGIESLNNTLEVAPRLAEFKRNIKNGNSIDKALFESQDLTVNFSRKGNVAKEADAFIPYLNAALQGFDKEIRVYNPMRGNGKNALNSLVKSVYAITIPTMILYAMNHDDTDYKMLSDYQKDNYYNIPKGDGTFWKIPKPREAGVIFGALIERLLRSFKDNDPQAFNRFADTIKQNFKPPTEPVFMPAYDIWSSPEGKDWRGNPIVNQSMLKLSPRYQYDENTSEPGKFIGNLFNISPKKIDATAKSYLGGVAQLGLPATTKGKSVIDTLKSQFTVDPAYNNDIMNDFYNKLNSLEIKANDKDFLSGVSGKLDTRQTTSEEKEVSIMRKYKKQIDDINKIIKATDNIEEKRRLRLQMLQIAKQALEG
ncbi:MAG: hypothetical protein N3I35_06775 [Clostridia bacterium]|nr:hypothetical protein [Clostridia bacterium]